MAKTVLPSKFVEWQGLDRIALVVHEMRFIWREISKDDYGIDGEIQIVIPKQGGEGYETTDGIIKVQSKAGASYVIQDTPSTFNTPVSRGDLESWYGGTYPVLFIVYHPTEDKLYWKEVKSYVKNTPNAFCAPYRIIFDKQYDVFDATWSDRIKAIAKVSPPRVSSDQRERLYSNLLLVKRGPRTIYHAPTEYATETQVRDELQRYTPPFCIEEGTLFSLADLRHPKSVLRAVCDTGAIGEDRADHWEADHDLKYIFLLNQLLGSHLRRCGLLYNRDYRRNYFPKHEQSDDTVRLGWYNVRTSRAAPRRIVAKYYHYGIDRFWRHLALNVRFLRVAGASYLQLNPKYFFTTDGEQPYDNERVGALTTKIKAAERNNHVLNHVLFWADVLSQHEPSINLRLFGNQIMAIEKEPISGIAGFAIPNDPAIYEEEDSSQLDFSGALTMAGQFDDTDDDQEEVNDDEY